MNELFCDLEWLKTACIKRFPVFDSLYVSTRQTKVLYEFYKKPVLEQARGWSYHTPGMPDAFVMFTGAFRGTIVLELRLTDCGEVEVQNVTDLGIVSKEDLLALVTDYVAHLKEKTKERSLSRCKTVKEELMMATWHPDRVCKWMEAGLDVEDM